jgi:hypothetical protein
MVYLAPMATPSKTIPEKDERAERLAAALRENLKRRKAQSRVREDAKTNAQPPKSPSK